MANNRISGLSIILLLALGSSFATAQEPQTPPEIVQKIAGEVLAALQADRPRYEADPEALADLVRDKLVPSFDIRYSARLILGRHGRNVSSEQIDDFANALVGLLAVRYAEGLIKFNSKEQIEILPARGAGSDKLTRVRTRVGLGNGKFAPVDYTFHKTDQGWQVFDVTVEGISYVTTYRGQFGREIQSKGLPAVIDRLLQGENSKND